MAIHGSSVNENLAEEDLDASDSLPSVDPRSPTVDHGKEEERKILAEKERRAVTSLRIAVFVVLTSVAILVSVGVYFFMSDFQRNEFELQAVGYSERIVDAFQSSVESKLGSLETLAAALTSHSLSSGNKFPNVTLPNWEIHSANTRTLAETLAMLWTPLVTDENREGWEAYASENYNWLGQSFLSEEEQRIRQDARYNLTKKTSARYTQESEAKYNPIIFGIGDDTPLRPKGSGPFLPYWQTSPVMPAISILNFDLRTHPLVAGLYDVALESKQVVMNAAADLNKKIEGDSDGVSQDINDFNLQNGQYRHEIDTYRGSPISQLAYPVFDGFGEDRNLAGILMITLYWHLYFEQVLPENAGAVIAVLENTFNQTFSYKINGQNVEYLGPEDHHDSKYDHLVVQASIDESVQQLARPSTRSYTTPDLNTEYCSYTIRVYPTAQLEAIYVDSMPLAYAFVVVAVFVFTSFIFILYDRLVQSTQRKIIKKAVKSGTIVSSLFPETVRERLFEEEKKEKSNAWKSGQDHMLAEEPNDVENAPNKSGKPIADLFPNCTVFFADIAGFTNFCAMREPYQVFELLEAIYGAFDVLAQKRNVFKVETIGDCFVAVTGLPVAQPDHAVRMCKFAVECLATMESLKPKLVDSLGEDILDLDIRVGMNSGPVTAGVLRGDRARFQLFGDTVNTASRMESNGAKGRIHISESTANELIAQGKGQWVKARDDKIVAKGKGELQTYWAEVRALKGSVAGRSSDVSSVREQDLDFRALASSPLKTMRTLTTFSSADSSFQMDSVDEVLATTLEGNVAEQPSSNESPFSREFLEF